MAEQFPRQDPKQRTTNRQNKITKLKQELKELQEEIIGMELDREMKFFTRKDLVRQIHALKIKELQKKISEKTTLEMKKQVQLEQLRRRPPTPTPTDHSDEDRDTKRSRKYHKKKNRRTRSLERAEKAFPSRTGGMY